LVENVRFSTFLRTPISFEALARGVPWDLRYELVSESSLWAIPDGDNRVVRRTTGADESANPDLNPWSLLVEATISSKGQMHLALSVIDIAL